VRAAGPIGIAPLVICSGALVAYDSGGRRWSCGARFRRVGQVGQYQTVKCARRGGKRVRFRGQP
jgi:hypothetical protein